jgi:hypothetical protein
MNDNNNNNNNSWRKYRQALLIIPKVYSHRIQKLRSGHGYYFPAIDSKEWLCCYKKINNNLDSKRDNDYDDLNPSKKIKI